MSPSNAYSMVAASIAVTCLVMFFLGEPPWILFMGGISGAVFGLIALITAIAFPFNGICPCCGEESSLEGNGCCYQCNHTTINNHQPLP